MSIESVVAARRERVAKAWNLDGEVVAIYAGTPISIPGGADQCFPYKPHPDYRWLSERQREGGVLTFDAANGWTLFEPPVTEMERVWGGGPEAVGRPIEELEASLGDRPVVKLGFGAPPSEERVAQLQRELLGIRRTKDAPEIELVERAVRATKAAHAAAREAIRPGATERLVQIELETAALRAGATAMGYATIVGSGGNSAVFHATPSDRVIAENEFVLVDAAGEVDGYTADVTRTFASSGRFTPDQQWVYDAVLQAETRAVEACRIGTEWGDVHLTAARSLAGSLVDAGILRCSAEEAVESELIALFFPHGVGHMVGLGVRDASGPAAGRKGDRKFGGITLRMDLPLDDHFLVTVEPGLYFIPALLREPGRRERFANQVDWAALEPLIGQGGVRIEDNVLVTSSGPVNLTASIPK